MIELIIFLQNSKNRIDEFFLKHKENYILLCIKVWKLFVIHGFTLKVV